MVREARWFIVQSTDLLRSFGSIHETCIYQEKLGPQVCPARQDNPRHDRKSSFYF
jgi:hypothetical protein